MASRTDALAERVAELERMCRDRDLYVPEIPDDRPGGCVCPRACSWEHCSYPRAVRMFCVCVEWVCARR